MPKQWHKPNYGNGVRNQFVLFCQKYVRGGISFWIKKRKSGVRRRTVPHNVTFNRKEQQNNRSRPLSLQEKEELLRFLFITHQLHEVHKVPHRKEVLGSLPTFVQELIKITKKKKKKLHGLSPRANYTDRGTAACRRSVCQLLRIKGATWSAWRIPTAVCIKICQFNSDSCLQMLTLHFKINVTIFSNFSQYNMLVDCTYRLDCTFS
jgi:hypothetical protein